MKLQYKRLHEGDDELYKVVISNLKVINGNEIELVDTEHDHNHVLAVDIYGSKIPVMPNIGKHFQNVSVLSIERCGLVEITKKDFELLTRLKALLLSNNLIESLPADVFALAPQLTHLSLRNNKIKFISQHTLTPLKRLIYADFSGNIAINEIYRSIRKSPSDCTTMPMLLSKILAQCKPPNEQISTIASYVISLWQGLLSDFQIKANGEVFNVHKAVLAANSPVFAAMFSHGMEENLKNEMTIQNFRPETVKELLAFVYLREVPKIATTELYAMAHEYQIKELYEQIQWQISVDVDGRNASKMLKFGVLYNNEVIKQAAFQAIEEEFKRKLPRKLLESAEDLVEFLDVKDQLDEILKKFDQN